MDRTKEFCQLAASIKVEGIVKRPSVRLDDELKLIDLSSQFMSEAKSILRDMEVIEARLGGKDETTSMSELDKSLQRIAKLQELTDRVEELEKPKSTGWFGSSQPKDPQRVQHLSTILWFLNHRHTKISKAIIKVQERQLKSQEQSRMIQDKRLTALASVKIKSPTKATSTAELRRRPEREEKLAIQDFAQKYGLSSEQVQMLQHEKQELFHELKDMQGQMRQTEKSVAEISRLQTTLQESLMYQEGQIERLYEDVDLTIEMVQKGNTFLSKASKNQSTFSKVMVALILFMTTIMLFMHFYLD